jgi:pilus assembly protein Flp/PilA
VKIVWNSIFYLNRALVKLEKDEKGQAFSEYAIIIGVVAVLIIATLVLFKDALTSLFTRIIGTLNNVGA